MKLVRFKHLDIEIKIKQYKQFFQHHYPPSLKEVSDLQRNKMS